MISPLLTQSCSGVIDETGRSAKSVVDGRQYMRGLPVEAGIEVLFINPDTVVVILRISKFSHLPVDAPPAVGSVNQIYQPVEISYWTIVIYCYKVAILIKIELMDVPQSGSIDLKIATVRIHPHDCTLIDRKSTRLNSSHVAISYAVFCLKQQKNQQ